MTRPAAIITAAGASTRMGEHKALLDWRGRPLVAYQVDCLVEAGFEPVVVVTGAESERVAQATPDAALIAHNADWESGRSGSIEVGAAQLPDDAAGVLVVAVDQPLEPHVLAELEPHIGAPVVQPVDADGRPGHPVILGGDQVEALRTIEREPEGLRSLVRRLRDDGILVPVDDLPHWDLNTPEAYRQAHERAGHS